LKNTTLKAQIFILIASILWGTTGTVQEFLPESANPLVISAMRMVIGGVLLLIIGIRKGALTYLITMKKKNVLLAAICMALYQPLFFCGVSRTGVALGTVLAIGSAPIFSGVIEFFRGKNPGIQWIFATGISIIGCILLFTGKETLTFDSYGAFLSLGAGLFYSFYVTVSQKLFIDSPGSYVNGLIFLLAAIILSPILIFNDLTWIITFRGLIPVLHIGIIATALAYTLFAYGLSGVAISRAVTLTLAEPLTATLLGIIVLKEKLTYISMIGIIVILMGLVLTTCTIPGIKNKKIIHKTCRD